MKAKQNKNPENNKGLTMGRLRQPGSADETREICLTAGILRNTSSLGGAVIPLEVFRLIREIYSRIREKSGTSPADGLSTAMWQTVEYMVLGEDQYTHLEKREKRWLERVQFAFVMLAMMIGTEASEAGKRGAALTFTELSLTGELPDDIDVTAAIAFIDHSVTLRETNPPPADMGADQR